MANRYLAIVLPTPEHSAAIARQNDFGLIRAWDTPHILVLVERETRVLELADGCGVIIGEMFDRGDRRALTHLDADASQDIVASGGGKLMQRYWGGYIAFLPGHETDAPIVVRAPLGDLPCLHAGLDTSLGVASDLTMLRQVISSPWAIDWPELGRYLMAPDVRRPRTCLAGVEELQGGDRLAFADRAVRIDTLWSPWMFVAPDRTIIDVAEARARLRGAVDLAVAARSSTCGRILARMSGGLDSSIMVASLASAGRDIVGLTMVTDDPSGDERYYARIVAEAFDVGLVEQRRSVARVDPMTSRAAEQPRPSTRLFQQDSIAAAREVAALRGADVVFDGGGGDNVFCYLQSVAPIVDRYRTSGWGPGVWRTLGDVARLTRTPVVEVAHRAFRRAMRQSPRYRLVPKTQFLSTLAMELAASATDHPWLDCPPHTLPGKAAQVALLVSAQSWVESLDPLAMPASVSPLLAQPVIEVSLAIPSWMHVNGGSDRAVARAAFRGRLPDTIIDRRSKAGPDGFLAQIFEMHRSVIREMLLDGLLAHHGLIDVVPIEAATRPASYTKGYDFLRILHLIDAEAWARSVR